MEQAFVLRETLISYYKQFELIIMFVLKFIVGVFLFNMIINIGFASSSVAFLFDAPLVLPLILVLSALFAACPMTICYALIFTTICLQLSNSFGILTIVALFFLGVMFFYVRIAPTESVLILAMFLGFYFKVPYAVPIIAGLYFGLTSIIPIVIGVFGWYFTPVVSELLKESMGAKLEILDLPTVFSSAYVSIFESIRGKENWIFTAFIFAMIVIVVYIISKTSINYAKDVSIAIGGIVCILCFIVSVVVAELDVSIISVVFFTTLSVLICELIKFFDIVVDYQRVEAVQFEDENNLYIVKVIPKIILTKKSRTLKRIKPITNEADDEYFDDEDPLENYHNHQNYRNYEIYEKNDKNKKNTNDEDIDDEYDELDDGYRR